MLKRILLASSYSGPRLERVIQTGLHFVIHFWFDHDFSCALSLCVPDDRSIFFFDSVQNVRCIRSPAAGGEYCVSESELGKRDLAASEKCGWIRAQRGTNPRRREKIEE